MGRKGNSKRKPSQSKIKPVITTAGGGNSISSLVQGKDKQPVRIAETEKDSVSSGSKKGQKKR